MDAKNFVGHWLSFLPNIYYFFIFFSSLNILPVFFYWLSLFLFARLCSFYPYLLNHLTVFSSFRLVPVDLCRKNRFGYNCVTYSHTYATIKNFQWTPHACLNVGMCNVTSMNWERQPYTGAALYLLLLSFSMQLSRIFFRCKFYGWISWLLF